MLIQIVDTPRPKKRQIPYKHKMLVEALQTLPPGKSIMLDVSSSHAKDPSCSYYEVGKKAGIKVSIHFDRETKRVYITRADQSE